MDQDGKARGVGLNPEARRPTRTECLDSLVGWGAGEDEDAGAILKVRTALGIFYFEPYSLQTLPLYVHEHPVAVARRKHWICH